jgi:hypothetical protein
MQSKIYGSKLVQPQLTESTEKSLAQASSMGVYIAIVKDNADPMNMGRLRVYVPEFGGNPEDEDKWIHVAYASPMAGTTSIYNQGSNVKEYSNTIQSYGFWAHAPELESQILVAFAAGKIDKGFWFASLFQTGTTGPIPGLPAGKTYNGENRIRTNKNRKDKDADLDKRVDHALHNRLIRQGLDKDPIRGLSTSGAERENASRVTGILTKGQHSFVMDDGDVDGNSKLIRLRTSSGNQILMDDVSSTIYVINAEGTNWVELGGDGRIYIYAANDISVNTEGTLNLRASKNINIEAGKDLNLSAANNMYASVNDYNLTASGNLRESVGGEASIKVNGNYLEEASSIHMNGPSPSAATLPVTNTLVTNTLITSSICTIVPEIEPWNGHTGIMFKKGPGNKQMKKDPAPKLVPVKPKPGERGATIVKKPSPLNEERSVPKKVETLTASPEVAALVKDSNEFRPYPYDDDTGMSAGFGTEVTTTDEDKSPTEPVSTSAPAEEPALTKEERERRQAEAFGRLLDARIEEDQLTPGSNKWFAAHERTEAIRREYEAIRDGQPLPPTGGSSSITEPTQTNNVQVSEAQQPASDNNITRGFSQEKFEQDFNLSMNQAQTKVKSGLSKLGIKEVPQKVFDGFTSMAHQVGDFTTAFVNNKKVDLTDVYKEGDWDRAASFIAQDSRDPSRRQAEANMIVNADYGNPRTSDEVVADGMAKTKELADKGRLNEQTNRPPSPAQLAALKNAFIIISGGQVALPIALTEFANKFKTAKPAPEPKKWGY